MCFLSWQRAFPDGPKEELPSRRTVVSSILSPRSDERSHAASTFCFWPCFSQGARPSKAESSECSLSATGGSGPFSLRRKVPSASLFPPFLRESQYETRIGAIRKAIQRSNEPSLQKETQHSRCSGFLLTYPCLRMIFVALAFVFCLLSDPSTLWLSPVPSGIASIHGERSQGNGLFGSSLTRTLRSVTSIRSDFSQSRSP